MTYDDGMLYVYRVENAAAPGDEPVEQLTFLSEHYFAYETLGYQRYYTALQVNQQIEAVVDIPDWHDITAKDICMIDGRQYKIQLSQPTKDDYGLNMTRLTLERINEKYKITPGCNQGCTSDGKR